MGARHNEDLVRRWIEEGWNGDDNERVMREVFAEDWVDGDDAAGPHGWEGVRAFVSIYRTAFPDIRLEIAQIVADDAYVAFRWSASGTHRGNLFGIPPTERAISITGHTLHRIEDRLLKESWVQTDTIGLLRQLGIDRLPG